MRAIVAEQKGIVQRDRVFTIGGSGAQAGAIDVDDYQVEARRFFFTIDPRRLAAWPNVDILDGTRLRQAAATGNLGNRGIGQMDSPTGQGIEPCLVPAMATAPHFLEKAAQFWINRIELVCKNMRVAIHVPGRDLHSQQQARAVGLAKGLGLEGAGDRVMVGDGDQG